MDGKWSLEEKDGRESTCKERRRGLAGPRETRDGDCLQASAPSEPALILKPESMSSKLQRWGLFCHNTNPPNSPAPCFMLFIFPTLNSSPPTISEAAIFTFPITHILSIAFRACCPPEAAMYCCTMYKAIDRSCTHTRIYIYKSCTVYIRKQKEKENGMMMMRTYNGVGSGVVMMRGDWERDERSSDESKQELNVEDTGLEILGWGALVVRPGEPRLDGPPWVEVVGVGAEHFIGEGDLQHRLQAFFSVEVGPQLSHN